MRMILVPLATLVLAACNQPAKPPAVPAETASAMPAPTPTTSAAPDPSQPPPDHVPPTEDAPRLPAAPTIYVPEMAERLRHNKGLTLQWIDWNRRGTATVDVQPDGEWHLTGSQRSPTTDGRLTLDGVVTEVGRDYFVFDGTITITDAPDKGRKCSKDKVWQFGITQNRQYWRLREFEWCDGLTDYIDIYF